MGFTVDGFNRDKDRMLSAFNKAIADAEALRKAETDIPHGDSPAASVPAGQGPAAAGTSPAESSRAVAPGTSPDSR